MEKATMLQALKRLDTLLSEPLKLLVGGGAAMLILYGFPLATSDIDAVPYKSALNASDLKPLILRVAEDLKIPRDWLNDYFSAFLYALPRDYGTRLKEIYHGKSLQAMGLGKEDLLILKCMAGRTKDRAHALSLIRQGPDLKLVEDHLQVLVGRGIPRSQEAVDFFDELMESV